MFSKFKNKIEYIVIDKPPSTIRALNENDDLETRNSKMLDNSLIRENHQRNALIQGLNDTDDDDLIIVSDVDEIPNLSNFDFNSIFKEIILFKQNFYYYKFNLKLEDMPWLGTKACKYKIFNTIFNGVITN